MLARRDITLAFAALLAAVLAMVQYVAHPAEISFALLPLVVLALLTCLPLLARADGFTLVAALMTATVLFDEPHNAAYNEWTPWTKALGPLLFERLKGLGVPGLIATPFELLSLGLAAWLAFKYGRAELVNLLTSRRFRLTASLALALPAAGLVAVARGQLNGGQLGVALTQLRCLPVFGLWLYLGYVSFRRPGQVKLLFQLLLAATTVKCLQGWYAFFVVYNGQMGSREYLMEHITSEHIAICMLLISYLWWHRRRHVWHDVAAALSLAGLVLPYFLNLRRASFLGLGLTVVLLPVVYPQQIKRLYLLVFAALSACAAALLALLWDTTSPLAVVVYPFKRFFIKDKYFALDYRDVENFNQFHTAMQLPLSGHGFGHRMQMFMPLTDISDFYPLYDVLPHNNVLFFWAAGGPLAVGVVAALAAVSLALTLRLARRASTFELRWLAFAGWGMVLRWLIYAYTDLGVVFFRLPALLGLVIGMTIYAVYEDRHALV